MKQKGFTLIETLLVLVIISSIIVMALNYQTRKTDELRRDKAVLEYQQILNAALAYRVNTSHWPSALTDLTTGGYLPNMTSTNNPWGRPFTVVAGTNDYLFYVYSPIPIPIAGNASQSSSNLAGANELAGILPLGYASASISNNIPDSAAPCAATTPLCYVVASIPMPAYDLNNARSINFSNLYHHAACVPAPVCPSGMTPQIYVAPTSIAGFNDAGSNNVYPLESFTAYAVGQAGGSGAPGTISNVGGCDNPNTASSCNGQNGWVPNPKEATLNYWRVCLSITTAKGNVRDTNQPSPDWYNKVSVLAITRCAPIDGPVATAPAAAPPGFSYPAPQPPRSLGNPTVGPFNPLAQ